MGEAGENAGALATRDRVDEEVEFIAEPLTDQAFDEGRSAIDDDVLCTRALQPRDSCGEVAGLDLGIGPFGLAEGFGEDDLFHRGNAPRDLIPGLIRLGRQSVPVGDEFDCRLPADDDRVGAVQHSAGMGLELLPGHLVIGAACVEAVETDLHLQFEFAHHHTPRK